MPHSDHHLPEDSPEHGEVIARIHPALYTLAYGGSGVLVAGLGYIPSFVVVSSFDIPLNFILFLLCGTVCLGAGQERSKTIPGFLLAVIALMASCLHLLLVNDHPWHP